MRWNPEQDEWQVLGTGKPTNTLIGCRVHYLSRDLTIGLDHQLVVGVVASSSSVWLWVRTTLIKS